MPTPVVTIRVRAGHRLMERVQECARHLEITPSSFIEYAIESELSRQESDRAHEHRTLDALQRNVMASGQSVSLHHDDEGPDHDTCQLCLRPMPRGAGVDGPLLCDDCHALTRNSGAAP